MLYEKTNVIHNVDLVQHILKCQVTGATGYIRNRTVHKQYTNCKTRSNKDFINDGFKNTIRTVSHLADSNCPLPEPSAFMAPQQGAHCSIRGSSLPCW